MDKQMLNYLEKLKNQCYPRLTKSGIESSRQLHARLCEEKKKNEMHPALFENEVTIPMINFLLQPEVSSEVANYIFSISLQLIAKEPFQLEESVKLWDALMIKIMSPEEFVISFENRYKKALEPFALAELFKKDLISQKNSIKSLTFEWYITWRPIVTAMIALYYKSIYGISEILNFIDIKQQVSPEQKSLFIEQESLNKYFEIENSLSWLPPRFHLDVMIPVPASVLRKRGFFNQNVSKATERPEHSNSSRCQFNGGLL